MKTQPRKLQAMSTPWGSAQNVEIVSDAGIKRVSTASHGGYKVGAKLNREIPEVFRAKDGWYEEDCQWSIVWIFLSAHFNAGYFKAETFMQAQATITNWYPHEWQEFNGVEVSRSEKCFDCQRNLCRATPNDYPKEVANTGYGNYRVTTQEESRGVFHTQLFIQDKWQGSHYSASDNSDGSWSPSTNDMHRQEALDCARKQHGKTFELIRSGHYEKCGLIAAFPIVKVENCIND